MFRDIIMYYNLHTGFWWGNPREGDHLEDVSVDGKIILNWIFKKRDGGVDWMDMTQDTTGDGHFTRGLCE